MATVGVKGLTDALLTYILIIQLLVCT